MSDRGKCFVLQPLKPKLMNWQAAWLCLPALGLFPGPALAQSFGSGLWTQQWEWPIFALLAAMIVYGIVLNRRLDRQRQQSQAAEQVFRELAEASADWVWQTDAEGRYTEISAGFERMSGQEASSIIGRSWQDCQEIAIKDEHRQQLKAAIGRGKPVRGIIAVVERPSKGQYHVRITGWPFFDDEGRFAGYRGFALDNTALVAARDEVKFLNEHDRLTGLPNRAVLAHQIDTVLKRKNRDKAALIAVDIKRFRSINEGYGDTAGDGLIRQFASRLREAFGDGDLITRYTNDEFVILRERISALDPLPMAITRLHSALSAPFEVGGDKIGITARVGIYEVEAEDHDTETCLKRVQIALTQSKREGQYVTIYAPGMDQEAATNRRLEDDLRAALSESGQDDEGLRLVFQPQMCLQSGRIVSAEALMRWFHPTLGQVSPGRFIPLAESSGMITDLSLWALRHAGEALQVNGDLSIAVNISALDFKQTDLVFAMEAIVDDMGIDASRIELEVTESVLITESQAAHAMLTRLKEAGFRIALDDFGTGYAGLGYLQIFPFDKLKIDQSFIQRLDESSHAQAIVRSVIKLAHDLGLRVVAEGVERLSQIDQLKLAGCDVIQGYILGQPVTANKLADFQRNQPTIQIGDPDRFETAASA